MHENNIKLAPIALFCYNRIEELQKTIIALQKCEFAAESELFIFSDGPKKEKDRNLVDAVRSYALTVSNFKQVHIECSKVNKGLAKSIIEGVTQILQKNDSIIVLEDDLISSTNFLRFMNQALDTFKENQKIISISGFTIPVKIPSDYKYDSYLTRRATSWGWATWKDRWNIVDWKVSDYGLFCKNNPAKREFNKMGSDMSQMLDKQMNGKINSWAIRWCYHQFKHDLYTVFPTVSKISNIGFGENATHTSGNQNRFTTYLDTSGKTEFKFKHNIELDPRFIKQFISTFSIPTRVFYKVKNILGF